MLGSHVHWVDPYIWAIKKPLDRVLDTTFTSGKSTVVQVDTKRKYATRYL